jgi:hypothetical protein
MSVELDENYFKKRTNAQILTEYRLESNDDRKALYTSEMFRRERHITSEPPTINGSIAILITSVLFLLIFSIIGLYNWYVMFFTPLPKKLFMRDNLLNGADGGFMLDVLWMVFAAISTPFALYFTYMSITDLIDIYHGVYII